MSIFILTSSLTTLRYFNLAPDIMFTTLTTIDDKTYKYNAGSDKSPKYTDESSSLIIKLDINLYVPRGDKYVKCVLQICE